MKKDDPIPSARSFLALGAKKGFGWFVLAMGIYILLKESVFK